MLLHEPFDFHAIGRAAKRLARCNGRDWTYADGHDRSLRLASGLLDLGLKPGDRIVTIVGNSLDALLIILAASRCGMVCVPLNCRLTAREWIAMATDAGARAIIADAAYCEMLNAAGYQAEIAICSTDAAGGWLALDAVAESASPAFCSPDLSDEMPVLQLYTSGTTGAPKGAMISHRSLLSDINQMSFVLGTCIPGQRSLHVLPFFHVAGVAFALRAMSGGETLVIHSAVDPSLLLRTLVEEEIAYTFIVPTIIQMLLQEPNIGDLDFPHLRQIIYGASPIAEHVLIQAMETFGCGFLQGFGMTELSCAATFLTEEDHARALVDRPELLASAGRPLPGTQLRIIDSMGEECLPGDVGELLIKGPQVFLGYWNLPEVTERTLDGGWLHSGDAGYIDDDGYLFIRDRIKDMIVSGGENIYPAEVEAVLHQHPNIAEACVIGVPDERWGETVMAVIVAERGAAPTEAELDSFCRDRLGGYKLPRRYSFVNSLPRNASGKILKRDLRAAYWSDQDRQIS